MIRIRTAYKAETEQNPSQIKAWAMVSGDRRYLAIPYDADLARDYGAEAPFRDAAEQLANRCRLGLVAHSEPSDRGFTYTVEPRQQEDLRPYIQALDRHAAELAAETEIDPDTLKGGPE